MALHDDPEDPALAAAYARTCWFEHILEVEYGERPEAGPYPEALNWFSLLPDALHLGLEDIECSLAYYGDTSSYFCALWEVTGSDDRPWLTFLVDDYGVRFLPEYSVLDEEADDETLDIMLAKSASELPWRLVAGEFDRTGEPLNIPDWLMPPLPESEE